MTTTARPTSDRAAGEQVSGAPAPPPHAERLIRYVIIGAVLGIVLIKAEIVSWYRIQEMFRFQSFHMYGVLGSAMMTAMVSLRLMKWMDVRSLSGEAIVIPPKLVGKGYRYWIGGALFGVGWAFTGACPGPLFALVGSGATVFVVVAIAALAGTWTYGRFRGSLPH
jgi:uncharacterized membrane protein YedE/YeeE